MKKLRLIFFAVIGLLASYCFTSCDDDKVNVSGESIVGQWLATFDWDEGNYYHSEYIEISSDGTLTSYNSQSDMNSGRNGYKQKWELSGNIFSIIDRYNPEDPYTLYITEFNDDIMRLICTYDDEDIQVWYKLN